MFYPPKGSYPAFFSIPLYNEMLPRPLVAMFLQINMCLLGSMKTLRLG